LVPTGHGFRFGPFTLLQRRRELLREGQPMAVGGRAYDLLWLLAENHHRIVEKEEILDRVWGQRCVEECNIPVQVARLRRLIGKTCILTVPLRGYQFMANVLSLDDAERAPEAAPARAAQPRRPARETAPAHGTTPLLGRCEELDSSLVLLRRHRSLTLTGPVGVGKSALARSLALSWSRLDQPVGWLRADAHDDVVSLGARISAMVAGWGPDVGPAADASDGSPRLPQPLVVLDEVERWTPTLRALARHLLGRIHGLHLLVTCPGPLDGANGLHRRLEPLTLPAQGLSPLGCVDQDRADVARPGWAHELLRAGAAARGSVDNDRWLQPTLAEARLCNLLDGRPGLLTVASRWVAMADAERATVWVVRDPSVIGLATASSDVRSLVTGLDHCLGMLDDGARLAYRELARPTRLPGVDETLRLLRRRGMTQGDALRAIADLLDLSLLRRIQGAAGGAGHQLLMAMPERWHALGRLSPQPGPTGLA
jgi:DNA-binding winged helix-turn-helix (wHTH) protein